MKRFQTSVLFTALVCVSLAVAACGGAGGSPTGGGGANGTAPAATATPKPKPTAVPAITTAFCQGIMTVAESNQVMQPPTPSTIVVADQGDGGGSCNYEPAPQQINLNISFQNWNGPNPIPQQDITAEIAKLASLNGVTVSTLTMVSGVGDQAAYVAAQGMRQGLTLKVDVFYVLYGKIEFGCATIFINQAAPSDTSQQSKLQQCAEQVVSRF